MTAAVAAKISSRKCNLVADEQIWTETIRKELTAAKKWQVQFVQWNSYNDTVDAYTIELVYTMIIYTGPVALIQ